MKRGLLVLLLAGLLATTATAASSGCYGRCVTPTQKQTARQAIRFVFQNYASEAMRVSSCESGLSVNAYNGQYLGLFQMGRSERARYGHGPTAWEQTIAAYRYFIASGRDWSPWECKP